MVSPSVYSDAARSIRSATASQPRANPPKGLPRVTSPCARTRPCSRPGHPLQSGQEHPSLASEQCRIPRPSLLLPHSETPFLHRHLSALDRGGPGRASPNGLLGRPAALTLVMSVGGSPDSGQFHRCLQTGRCSSAVKVLEVKEPPGGRVCHQVVLFSPCPFCPELKARAGRQSEKES